jgi:hypothetical protein
MRAWMLIIAVVACTACDFSTQDCLGDPQEYVRDPATTACIVLSNADGCNYCFDSCLVGDTDRFDYGACFTDCNGTIETDCLTRPDCRAAYLGTSYLMCLPTAPSGALRDGACDGLDAYECSRHDNCAAEYNRPFGGAIAFYRCFDEARPGQL